VRVSGITFFVGTKSKRPSEGTLGFGEDTQEEGNENEEKL
jgi:hypothetical protein